MAQTKLYSVIKSSVRQYLAFVMAQATIDLLDNLAAALGSRERLLEAVQPVAGMSEDQVRTTRWLVVGDEVLFDDEVDAPRANEVRRRLAALPAAPLTPFGDEYAKDDEGYQRIHVAKRPKAVETEFIFKTRFAPPDQIIGMMHSFVSSFAEACGRACRAEFRARRQALF